MRTILFDITGLLSELRKKRQRRGIPRVTLAYVHHYIDQIQVIVPTKYHMFILPKSLSKEIGLLLLQWKPAFFWKILRLMLKGVLLSKSSSLEGHFLIKTDYKACYDKWYFKSINKRSVLLLAMVHDLIPIENPELSLSNCKKLSKVLPNFLEHAKGIVVVSKTTSKSLSKYALSSGLTCPPVIPALLAPGIASNLPIKSTFLNETYFLTIGSIDDMRKNHLLLLQIWCKLVERFGDLVPKLVIIGRCKKKRKGASLAGIMVNHCKHIRGTIIIEPDASDTTLANYLNYARALLFPTIAEGYGLPVIEALAAKVPVIASDLPVFREFAGSVPDYIDPLDGKKWLETIEDYTKEDSPLRAAQLNRMRDLHIPKWKEHFAKVDAFMDELEKKNVPRIIPS